MPCLRPAVVNDAELIVIPRGTIVLLRVVQDPPLVCRWIVNRSMPLAVSDPAHGIVAFIVVLPAVAPDP